MICAAIGAARFSGKSSTAEVTNIAGKMWVAIDSALMPGSNTPKPPGAQIHSWLGCQRRTSSFQMIDADAEAGRREEAARGLHRRGIARMPAGEQRDALLRRQRLQVLDLADRRARRLLQEDVLLSSSAVRAAS